MTYESGRSGRYYRSRSERSHSVFEGIKHLLQYTHSGSGQALSVTFTCNI